MTTSEVLPSRLPESHALQLAMAGYLARFKGISRTHAESDLRAYLGWCADRSLDPLAAQLYDVQRQAVGGVSLPAFQDGSTGFVIIGPIRTTLNLFSGGRIVHSAKEGASYSLEPAKWEQHACSVAGRDFTRAEWALYLPQRAYESTCGFRTPTG